MSQKCKRLVLVVLTVYSVFCSIKVAAQSHRLDSLAGLIESEVSDSVRFWIYSEVIWANHRDSTEYALRMTHELMNLARLKDHERQIRIAHYYYGVIFKNTGAWTEALSHLDTVYRRSEQVKDTIFMSNAAYQQGAVAGRLSDYQAAVEYFNKNIELNTLLNRPARVATSWNSKASTYRSMKLYDLAIAHYDKSLAFYKSEKDSIGMANVYNNLGNVYAELDSFELALTNYNKQEAINLARDNTWGMGYVFENRGRLFEKMNRYEECVSSLNKSIGIRRQMGHQSILASSLITLSSCESKLNRLQSALKHVDEALDISKTYGMSSQLKEGYEMLSIVSAKIGNYKEAYENQILFDQLKDSLLNDQIIEQTLKIDALTDVENLQKEQQIALLSTENEIKDLRLKTQQRNLIFSTIGLIGLLAFSFYFFKSREKVQKLNSMLSVQKDVVSKSLVEKEYLLKEIHHRVKNNLQVISSLLKLQAKSIVDEKAQEALHGGRTRVRSMALIHQHLYKDDESPRGVNIKEYISDLSDELCYSYKEEQQLIDLDLNIQEMYLDIDTAVPIGLIINELISNSLKYAFKVGEVGEIGIRMKEVNGDTISLEYKDNGVGFNIEEVHPKSFGLRLIRSFAERLDAELSIKGDDGVFASFIIHDYNSLPNV